MTHPADLVEDIARTFDPHAWRDLDGLPSIMRTTLEARQTQARSKATVALDAQQAWLARQPVVGDDWMPDTWGEVNGIYWKAFEDARLWVGPIADEQERDRLMGIAHHAGIAAVRQALAAQPGAVRVPVLPEKWWSVELTRRNPGDELMSGEIVTDETVIEADIWCHDTDDILSGLAPTIEEAIAAAVASAGEGDDK